VRVGSRTPYLLSGETMQHSAKHILWLIETVVAIIVIGMVALTFADVIGRRLFGAPIYGANDLTEHMMALIVFAGLPIVTANGLHLTVDLFGKFLDQSAMRWWSVLSGVAVAIILALMSWLFFKQAETARDIREVSQALNVPRSPLYIYISMSCALSACVAGITAFIGPIKTTDTQTSEDML
jgi:TRAP-type C4-dicarboxylate transport system permease small subunit